MAPVPKKKSSHSRSRHRKSSFYKKRVFNLSKCSSCGKLRESHKACPHCGFYK